MTRTMLLLSTTKERQAGAVRPAVLLTVTALLTLLVLLLFLRRGSAPPSPAEIPAEQDVSPVPKPAPAAAVAPLPRVAPRLRSDEDAASSQAQQEVSARLDAFVQRRHQLAEKLAQKLGVDVPPEIDSFLQLVQEGNWDGIKSRYESLQSQLQGNPPPSGLQAFWNIIHESYGVAQVRHQWPPDQLLQFGKTILGALPAGGVYVGGTDAGTFIPTLMQASADQPHLVISQSQLVDKNYQEYLAAVFGDRLKLPSDEERNQALREALLSHGKREADGRMTVSGQEAATTINENLLRSIVQLNPEMPFGIEEALPLKSIYASASASGPLLMVQAGQTAAAAGQEGGSGLDTAAVLGYWQQTAQQMAVNRDTTYSGAAEAYGRLATSQANLLAGRNEAQPAEQLYRTAQSIAPTLIEPAARLADYLAQRQRMPEALQILDQFAARNPDQAEAIVAQRTRLANLPRSP